LRKCHAGWQCDLSLSHDKIGDVLSALLPAEPSYKR
jgi:hypothetical protein